MTISSKEDILGYLRSNKRFFYDTFGVTRIGLFGSFADDRQSDSSDIDMVVEFEKEKKNIHSFLSFKRLLESHLDRKVDLGFEHSLKPVVKEKVKGKILYV
jgi:predicted nucleotidyltransferase